MAKRVEYKHRQLLKLKIKGFRLERNSVVAYTSYLHAQNIYLKSGHIHSQSLCQ